MKKHLSWLAEEKYISNSRSSSKKRQIMLFDVLIGTHHLTIVKISACRVDLNGNKDVLANIFTAKTDPVLVLLTHSWPPNLLCNRICQNRYLCQNTAKKAVFLFPNHFFYPWWLTFFIFWRCGFQNIFFIEISLS